MKAMGGFRVGDRVRVIGVYGTTGVVCKWDDLVGRPAVSDGMWKLNQESADAGKTMYELVPFVNPQGQAEWRKYTQLTHVSAVQLTLFGDDTPKPPDNKKRERAHE